MAKFKVLVVDDSAALRKMISKALEAETEIFEVVGEASNGDEAIAQYSSLNPDLVTMDINMPGKDGKEAMKQILAQNANATVVMLTSEGKAQAVEAISLGAKDFIEKPTTPQIILEKLKNAMNV